MIDIADFAVGQSRMLYGNTMHSERPQHRMYEQWHPLGIVGTSRRSISRSRCGRGTLHRGDLRQRQYLEAVAEDALVRRRRAENLSTKRWRRPVCPTCFTVQRRRNALAQQFRRRSAIDLLSFTGSCAVGRQVGDRLRSAWANSCSNSAATTRSSSTNRQPRYGRPGIVFGSVGTAGQRCTTTRASSCTSPHGRTKGAPGRLRPGTNRRSAGPRNVDGAADRCESVERVEQAVAAGRSAGGEILCGGKRN